MAERVQRSEEGVELRARPAGDLDWLPSPLRPALLIRFISGAHRVLVVGLPGASAGTADGDTMILKLLCGAPSFFA